MSNTLKILLLAVFFSLISCKSSSSSSKASPEALLKQVFQAIKNNNWEGYSKLTVTSADFDMRKNRISPIKQGQSYVGSSVKPKQVQQQRVDFDDVRIGGEDYINFSDSEFVSLGSVIDQGEKSTITGAKFAYTVYSLKLKVDDKEIVTDDLDPAFVVVKWRGSFRLLGLNFFEEQEEQE